VITEADHANDIRSLRRKTQGFLYLACKSGYADKARWELPRVLVAEGETLRDAAKRCVTEIAGQSVETHFFGNSPAGHFATEDERTYYMLGVVLDGDVVLAADAPVSDFAWLQQKELLDAYSSNEVMKDLAQTLLEE
jgi:ADP-ribose pyrophosphatase YjhB (NUDIX family)